VFQLYREQAHNASVGHHGIHRTLENLRLILLHEHKERFIPNFMLKQAVKHFISLCPTRQKQRDATQPSHGHHFSTSSLYPFFEGQVDHQGPFDEDEYGNQYICSIICTFTDFLDVTPVRSVDAIDTARAFIGFLGRYGTPQIILSDQGPAFVAQIFENLVLLTGNKHLMNIPYSKATTARVERAQRENVRLLRAITHDLELLPE
jgi:hypothetical protein